jgi:hypothetical protein
MTQQVVKCVWTLGSTNPQMPSPSVDFIFEATGSSTTIDWTAADTPLTEINFFWNGTAGGMHAPLCHYLSSMYPRPAAPTIETYDITGHLNGSPTGSPIRIDTDYLGSGMTGTADLHPALTGVLAYRRVYGADPETSGATRPRARDRGRIHIGPLRNNCMDDGTGKADTNFQADLLIAAGVLAVTHNAGAANQFDWRQWSRMNASVGRIAFIATQYGLGIDRRRVDESNTRVLPWTAA